jgi:hypothetical protein
MGGNGDARVDKKDKNILVIKTLVYSNATKKLENMVNDWVKSNGTYAKYFKEYYDITFDLVNTDIAEWGSGIIYGKPVRNNDTVITIRLKVK